MAKAIGLAASAPNPANRRIMDLLLRHGVFVERYKTGLVNDIMKFFNGKVEPDIVRILAKNAGKGTITESKVKAMAADLKTLNAAYTIMSGTAQKSLLAFGISEADWARSMLAASVPVKIDFALPSPKQIEAVVSKSYIRGKLVKDWFNDLSASVRDKVTTQINIGMVEGEGIEQITRRIIGTQAASYTDGILTAERRNIEAVVRTSASGINNNVRKELYQANNDIIKGVQWVATLDDRTCEICMALDGKVNELDSMQSPPAHWNCRCVATPVLKSWKELGIDLKEAPAGTRASMDGQVPESLTYGRWLKGQDATTQDEILGIGKAQLFRRGVVPIDRFIDARNRPLTLGQLERLESKLSKAS